MRILSLGGGVQSTTMALLAAHGHIEPPHYAIFADTGWEPKAVYQHLDWLEKQLPFPVIRVSRGNIREDIEARCTTDKGRYPSVPWYMQDENGKKAIGRRQCTTHYKIEPILMQCRKLLGYRPRQRIPPGTVTMLIGISTDEALRMKPARVQYVRNTWPLIDLGMSRKHCLEWLHKNGYPTPPKSACIGCPYKSDALWKHTKEHSPDEWADAVAVDRMIRDSGKKRGIRMQQFMHRSRKPLDEVVFGEDDAVNYFNNECEGMCGV